MLNVHWQPYHFSGKDAEWFKELKPKFVKVVWSGPKPPYSESLPPGATYIYRDYGFESEHRHLLSADPVKCAMLHVKASVEASAYLVSKGIPTSRQLFESLNEPALWANETPAKLALYLAAFLAGLHEHALNGVVANLGVGWPNNLGPDTPPDWRWFEPAHKAMIKGDYLGLHEYWYKNGPKQMWGWWAGRAHKCPYNVPILITECGIDAGVAVPGSVDSWRNVWQGLSEDQAAVRFTDELWEYMKLMREDPRIQGIFPFTYDSSVDNNGRAKWAWFEQNVNPLKAAMRKKWAAEPIPQPKPFLWAAPGPSTPLPGPGPEPSQRATGIDVSQYQDQNLNWQALREAGFSFFFWRLTRGLSLDRAGFRHPNQSAGADLLSGPYHYLDATYGAREQARFFYSVLNDFPDGLVPVIDVEDDLLTPRNVRDCIDRFRELSGYWPMIYTSKHKWEKIVGRGATWAKQCPLWVAHAGVESPALPDIWDHWTFWQRGQTLTPAYPTKLDHNLFNGTEAQLRANFTHQPDEPEEPEKPPSIGVDFTVTHRPGIEAIIGNYPTPGLYATLRDPWGNTQSLITGSKPEYGAGGFLFNTWSLATYTLHIDGRDYPVKTVPLHTSFITFS